MILSNLKIRQTKLYNTTLVGFTSAVVCWHKNARLLHPDFRGLHLKIGHWIKMRAFTAVWYGPAGLWSNNLWKKPLPLILICQESGPLHPHHTRGRPKRVRIMTQNGATYKYDPSTFLQHNVLTLEVEAPLKVSCFGDNSAFDLP